MGDGDDTIMIANSTRIMMSASPQQQQLYFTLRLLSVEDANYISWDQGKKNGGSKRRRRAVIKTQHAQVAATSPALLLAAAEKNDNNQNTMMIQYAMVQAIQEGDVLDSIYSLQKDKYILYKKQTQASVLEDPSYYPLNVVLFRRPSVENQKEVASTGTTERPRKKIKKKKQKQKEPDVISIMDSSDDEEETGAAIPQQAPADAPVDSLPAKESVSESITASQYLAHPDPLPAFQEDSWVLTSMGAGVVLSTRVDRLANFILRPLLIYKIQLDYGVLYAPSTEVHALETTVWGQEVVVSQFNHTLRRQDVVRLRPDVYWNDSLVNFWLARLRQSLPTSRIHAFSSFFFKKLMLLDQQSDEKKNSVEHLAVLWKSLSRWTKDVDVLSMDFLVIPVNHRLHWSVVVVCHPGALLVNKQPCAILHLDSGKRFRLHRSDALYNRIRKYLNACREHDVNNEKGETDDLLLYTKESIPGLSPPVPAQDNETDCGIYMLEMIERFWKDPVVISQEFLENKGHAAPFGKDWFSHDAIERKRHDFKQLVYTLSRQQPAP